MSIVNVSDVERKLTAELAEQKLYYEAYIEEANECFNEMMKDRTEALRFINKINKQWVSLAPWLSAALSDDHACAEFKAALEPFFDAMCKSAEDYLYLSDVGCYNE